MIRLEYLILPIASLCMVAQSVHAIQVVLSPEQDNSIFEDGTSNSSSSGDYIFAGVTDDVRNSAGPSIRRGLIQFDVSSLLPAGAMIDSVTLSMTIAKDPDEKVVGTTQTLHRVTQEWGGSSASASGSFGSPGLGTAAEVGDATWLQSEFGSVNWTTPGGDFVAAASASSAVAPFINAEVLWTGSGLVNDVQSWLDDPLGNFGWILIGNENFIKNARGYYSMDNTDLSALGRYPELIIDYTLIPEVRSYGLILALAVGLFCGRRTRRASGY